MLEDRATSMWKICGTPCVVASTLYMWRVVLYYMPFFAVAYFAYSWVAIIVEDYMLPCIRTCKLISDIIQGLSLSDVGTED